MRHWRHALLQPADCMDVGPARKRRRFVISSDSEPECDSQPQPIVQQAASQAVQLAQQTEVEDDMAEFLSCSSGSDSDIDVDLELL